MKDYEDDEDTRKPVNEIDMSLEETMPRRVPASGDENNSKKTDLESNEVHRDDHDSQSISAIQKAKKAMAKKNQNLVDRYQISEILFLLWDGVPVFDLESYRLKRVHGIGFYSWFDKFFSLKWVFLSLFGAGLTVLFILLETLKIGTIKSQITYNQPQQQFELNLTDSFSAHFLTVFRPNEVNGWIRSRDTFFAQSSDLIESNVYQRKIAEQ